MPKRSKPESPEEQSERFKREAQKLIDAGELDPAKGEEALSEMVKHKPVDKDVPGVP